ncbi:putative MFS multidrug transporter [Rosellinia necatrix]|uniref:Putative MFS multidrug transporter n=1 Tax=Rosellinia necatrix TaxID=77044 RepID=A0A1W2TFR3_ROSNE|nr:putative MFS multidrug transporter [Rosellinia necatrix]
MAADLTPVVAPSQAPSGNGTPDAHTEAKGDVAGDVEQQKRTFEEDDDARVYLEGAQFWLVSASVAIMMFLTNLEVPVVTTALVAITNDLGSFENVGWVVASYLLGYVAVIVIFAKFSDIFGRKMVFVISTALFIIFSVACSAAQTLTQLIIFRAFQGIGGGGCFSLCTILVIELVPPPKYTQFVSNISVVNALSLLLGPIIGGAIASGTSWRWIFIINIPIALPALLISLYALPKDFPYQGIPNRQPKGLKFLFSKLTVDRVDIPGAVLILFATLALTAGFEEADKKFPWRSAYVITLLTVSGFLWIVLAIWERHVTIADGVREPILPWRFVKNREMVGILLNFLFLGGPTLIGMFIIPQRFQLVYGTSGLDAGVKLIPFTITIPFGAILASTLAGKLKIPALYVVIAGSVLQVVGFSLLGTLPSTTSIPAQIYGGEFVAGLGGGINFALLFVMIPFVNEGRDRAVGMGSGAQFRSMGSSIVLAVSTSVFNTYARPKLQGLLGLSSSDELLFSAESLASLAPAILEDVQHVLAEGYNRQVLVLAVSAALQVPASLMMWRKKQLVV